MALLSLPRRAIGYGVRKIRGLWQPSDAMDELYRGQPYLEAYAAHMDMRVAADPEKSVGGKWPVMGQQQIAFLKERGMQPRHRLLDIGCGVLRGGRYFIPYLDSGNYTGFDISRAAIDYGQKLVADSDLVEKRPTLYVNSDLRFSELIGMNFDYLLAQSVFSLLPPEPIEECIAHIGLVMHAGSLFFFTFRVFPEYTHWQRTKFGYPVSHFERLADRHGFSFEPCPNFENRNQKMFAMMKLT